MARSIPLSTCWFPIRTLPLLWRSRPLRFSSSVTLRFSNPLVHSLTRSLSSLGIRYDAPMFYDFEASESPVGQDRVDDWYVCCAGKEQTVPCTHLRSRFAW